MDDTAERTAPQHRFQFSLRTLLLLVFAAGIYIGYLIYFPDTTARLTFAALVVFGAASGNRYALVTIALLVILGVTLPLFSTHGPRKPNRDRQQLQAIAMALSKYHDDFAAYPPANSNLNGSQILYRSLAVTHSAQNQGFGPYLMDNWTQPEILSPRGNVYVYVLRKNSAGDFEPLIIDPSPDKLLGGSLDAGGHFIPDGSDANKDGVPDDRDNLYSLPNP
jgi:hypothetical protein